MDFDGFGEFGVVSYVVISDAPRNIAPFTEKILFRLRDHTVRTGRMLLLLHRCPPHAQVGTLGSIAPHIAIGLDRELAPQIHLNECPTHADGRNRTLAFDEFLEMGTVHPVWRI